MKYTHTLFPIFGNCIGLLDKTFNQLKSILQVDFSFILVAVTLLELNIISLMFYSI